jgi:oligopeptide/dipeptide ABC transporter ATP-binding protein
MNLISPPGKIISGKIFLDGEGDLLRKTEDEMRKIRGDKISMIFQDPTSSLNPVLKVDDQISEVLIHHKDMTKAQAYDKTIEILELVGIPSPESRAKDYPHLLSGGMKQRIMIALAMICEPQLLIADEPTTNLDVTVQLQILDLMKELQRKYNTAILLITHNLGIVSENCDRVGVMYAGQMVEVAQTKQIFRKPEHPYTIGLLNAIPRIDQKREWLPVIQGMVPGLINPPAGCRFIDRCEFAMKKCNIKPKLEKLEENHFRACYKEVKKIK